MDEVNIKCTLHLSVMVSAELRVYYYISKGISDGCSR